MRLDLIETLKTSIYNPKHTKNTKIHFINSKRKKREIIIFQNFEFEKSAFFDDFHGPPWAGLKF